MSEDNSELIKILSIGKIRAIQQMLWNDQGSWPDDMDDKKQNPHGRPINYWVPVIDTMSVRWNEKTGWHSKDEAIEAAKNFQQQCIDWLKKNKQS